MIISIANQIARIKDNIGSAYDGLEQKGAVLPETENSANLRTAVNSLPDVGEKMDLAADTVSKPLAGLPQGQGFYTDNTIGVKTSPALSGTAQTIEAYSTQYLDAALSAKADKAATLAGYGITDAYTKAEVDRAIADISEGSVPAYIESEVSGLAEAVNARRNQHTLTMLFISDIHVDPKGSQYSASAVTQTNTSLRHAGQAISLLSEKVPFDLMCMLGDYVGGTSQTVESGLACFKDVNEALEKGFSKAQNIRICGNHDSISYSRYAAHDYYTPDQLYNLTGRYNSSPVYGCREKNYGYIDLDAQKVRIIFVNANVSEAGLSAGYIEMGYYDDDQLQWFADTLGEVGTKTGWSFMVLSHQPLDFMTGHDCGDILASYAAGGAVSLRSGSVSYDFSGRNSAQFIMNVHGHIHNCLTSHLYQHSGNTASATSYIRQAIPNACFYFNGNSYDSSSEYDSYRHGISYDDGLFSRQENKTADSANDTAFTVLTVDTNTSTVYVDQYGFGNSKGCNRSFNYSTGVISSDSGPRGTTPTPTPSYTNQLPISQYPIGTVSGVMNGKRWSSSGSLKDKESEVAYAKASGYIPISTGDVVRMSGVKFGPSTVQKNTTAYLQSFGSGGSVANMAYAGQFTSGTSSVSVFADIQYDNNGNVVRFTYNGGNGYLTLCSNSTESHGGIPDDAVLTINEAI